MNLIFSLRNSKYIRIKYYKKLLHIFLLSEFLKKIDSRQL